MTGGTENLAKTTMRKTCTIGDVVEDDGDGDDTRSASASGLGSGQPKNKGEELKKTLGSVFDSMVPLKAAKSKRNVGDDSDQSDDGAGKRRRGGRGGGGQPPRNPVDPEARNCQLSYFWIFQ